MGAHLGNTEIGQMFLGSTEIGQAYLGNTKVWEKGGVTPPQPLPYDAEIEYLQSSGTQYIDTQLYLTTGFKAEVRCSFTSTADFQIVLGSRDYNSKDGIVLGRQRGASGSTYIQVGTSGYALSNISDTSIKTYLCSIYADSNSATKQSISESGNTSSNNVNVPFSTLSNYLFAGNYTSGITRPAYAKVYSCKIWDNDVLVCDFIPVRVGTTGYMYDKVSGQLFGNSGTGSFVLGNDITT